MPDNVIRVGDVEILALSDGSLEFDLCNFFPTIPEDEWQPYGAHLTEAHKVRFNLGSYLIRADGRTILVDPGRGPRPKDTADAPGGEPHAHADGGADARPHAGPHVDPRHLARRARAGAGRRRPQPGAVAGAGLGLARRHGSRAHAQDAARAAGPAGARADRGSSRTLPGARLRPDRAPGGPAVLARTLAWTIHER